ncbi:PREDICTED: 3beta-hydroxysteroid-dehydrogenase/decarboxylase-like isoform X2 [Nelumbo nucifera]|uniref:Reticulon-like protein n=1 Tax=Nelumbo nucifera TaxID=4432 RepID=A0A1U8AYU2_NELNU|nr:PREDICTED: 3beta-hydroxysteroid-dehydrogenase/decarboxylase-like isoform X2 [Nelumbo nucifera]
MLVSAIQGSSTVFHMDAIDSSLNNFYIQYTLIVQGTKNVISACRDCEVKRLLYNSSADVVSDGVHDIYNGDESLPMPWRFKDMLSDLKAQAEGMVLFSNGCDGLLTCALRPSNAFGPGDKFLIPFLLTGAKLGWTKFIIGSGENMCDFTYVENIAHAHICAVEALHSAMTSVAGKAFFITNLQPVKFWEFVCLILEGLGYQRPTVQLPARMVSFFFVLVRWVHKKLGYEGDVLSLLTPVNVHLLSHTKTFNCSVAQNHIGYSPIISLEEGVTLTIESFSHLEEASPSMRFQNSTEPSKANIMLGSGRVADILLWRDEKKTFSCFLASSLLFHWYILSGRTFISSTAKLLLVGIAILFSIGFLPSRMFGFTFQGISSYFEISESVIRDAFLFIASVWNRAVLTLRSLAQGSDWNFFFKVATPLYFLRLLLPFSFSAVVSVALVFVFTAFFVYEQYEDEASRVTEAVTIGTRKLKGLLIRKLPPSLSAFACNYNILSQDEFPAGPKDQQIQHQE